MFYGNRYSELRLARKSDFDFSKNTWTVPYENHKTGESKGDIVRPIIDEIKPWLQSAMDLSNSEYIFPHENGKEPMGRSGPTDTLITSCNLQGRIIKLKWIIGLCMIYGVQQGQISVRLQVGMLRN